MQKIFELVHELGKKHGVLQHSTLTLLNLSVLYACFMSDLTSMPADTRSAQVFPLAETFSPEIVPLLEEVGRHLIYMSEFL